jgi:hypothetical protein
VIETPEMDKVMKGSKKAVRWPQTRSLSQKHFAFAMTADARNGDNEPYSQRSVLIPLL